MAAIRLIQNLIVEITEMRDLSISVIKTQKITKRSIDQLTS